MGLNKEFGDVDSNQIFTGGPAETAVAETFTTALVEGKALADDGNLYSTVQGAQDAASGWVFLPPVTFNESVTIDTASLTLVGSGFDTLLDAGSNGTAIEFDAPNITVSNMRVETTNGGGSTCMDIFDSYARVHSCYSTEFDTMFDLGNGSGNVITECSIRNGSKSYLETGSPTNTIVTNNILISENGISVDGGQDGIFANNIIYATTASITIFNDSADNMYIGNQIDTAGGDNAIYLRLGSDIIIANNRVSGWTTSAIYDTYGYALTDGNQLDSARN